MTNKMFSGKIKYLGDTSNCQLFKAATVSLSVENGRSYLETRLKCNPARIYKRNEISGAEAQVKSNRLIVKYTSGREYWELHFLGDAKQTSQKLYDDIQSMLKASSKTPQSKADVGSEKKMGSALNGRLIGLSPKTDQGWQPLLNGPSRMGQETPCPDGQKLASGSSATGGDHTYQSQTSQDSNSSPCFTRVKENKRQNSETKNDSDDESKENQHRGPVNQNVDQQNKQGDRKPLQISSFRFYGTQEKSSITEIASNNTFFKVTKCRPVSSPSFAPEGRKGGQLSGVVSAYSWNNVKSTPTAAVRKEMPQLQGFANLGNTCYMNAILQSLFGLDTFSMDLHSMCRHYSKVLTKQSLAVALTRLMLTKQRPQNNTTHKVEELLISVKRAISTTAKRFIGSQQHDAHEFLCQVLDQLKEEVIRLSKPKQDKEEAGEEGNKTPSSAASPDTTNSAVDAASGNRSTSLSELSSNQALVMCKTPPRVGPMSSPIARPAAACNGETPTLQQQSAPPAVCSVNGSLPSGPMVNPTFNNFEFEVVHSFRCINCQEQIQKVEQFNDLSVDIPKCSTLAGIVLSLQDALDIFFQKEEIDYWCEKCGHTKAGVTHKFAKLPRVLILHLKRYSYSAWNKNWNKKVQEKLQLPRYITLQDHCDASTVPHLPYSIMQLSSPLKSPVCNSPVSQPAAATPDYRQRRHRPFLDENGTFRGHKKVRRNLLAEVHDEAPHPDKKPRTSLNCPESAAKEETETPKPEVITLDMETEDPDPELQRALDLSLQEYQQSQSQSLTNNNGTTWQQDSPPESNEVSDEGNMDYGSMPYDKQLQLAIKRSLADCSPPTESDSENSAHQNENLDSHPPADSSVFKKPLSAPRKENKRTDLQTSAESSITADITPVSLGNSELDMSILGVRSFTSASDFMHDTDIRQRSPDRGDCDSSTLDCPQAFTSCKNPHSIIQVVPETPETSSVSVSTNIGSLGALSTVSTRMGDVGDDIGMEDESRQDLTLNVEREEFRQGHSTPVSSPKRTGDSHDLDSSNSGLVTEVWTPEEEKQIAEAFQDEWMETSDAMDIFNQGGKGGTEEKENMSPVTGGKSQTDGGSTEAPLDKETEARQLQYQLRQTEIEKGILPHSYRLVSIVNHHGETSSFGHYVSDVFDIKKQAWFSFDDKNVEKTTESFVRTRRTNTGYIFFYLSKDIFDDIEASRPGGKELIERS